MRDVFCFRHIGMFLAAGLILTHGNAVYAQETESYEKKRIAVLTYSYSSEYWGYVGQGCKACESSDPGIDVVLENPSSSVASGEQEIMLQADLDAGRYDAYVIAPISKEQIEKILENVTVPVVAVDSMLDADCVIGGIGTDNEIAAAAGAKKAVSMAQAIGWEAPECAVIAGRDEDSNNQSRIDGYHQGVDEAGGIWLDKVYSTDKSESQAEEAMKQIMEDYPEGIAVICCYNDMLAEAALSAAQGNEAYVDTVFLGFDGNGSVCERILNDEAYSNYITVAQNPYEMGYYAVDMLRTHFFEGEKPGNIGGGSDESSKKDASGTEDTGDGTGTEETDNSGMEDPDFRDSGYSVITKDNVRERMVQIQSHLS